MLTKIVHRTRDCVGIIAGVEHTDGPLQLKYWGVRAPMTLTPMKLLNTFQYFQKYGTNYITKLSTLTTQYNQNKTITFWIACKPTLTVKLPFSFLLFYKTEIKSHKLGQEFTLISHQIIKNSTKKYSNFKLSCLLSNKKFWFNLAVSLSPLMDTFLQCFKMSISQIFSGSLHRVSKKMCKLIFFSTLSNFDRS